jgi:hypothetical protein
VGSVREEGQWCDTYSKMSGGGEARERVDEKGQKNSWG